MRSLLLFIYGIGPTTLGAIVLAGVLLARGRRGTPPLERATGAAIFGAGLALRVWGTQEVIERGDGTPIYSPLYPMEPKRLVTSGPYRYSRNPLYLAKLAIMAGLVLLSGRPALLGVAVAWGAALHAFVVPAEEAKLRSLFGEEYARYRRAVPRWLPWLDGARAHAPRSVGDGEGRPGAGAAEELPQPRDVERDRA